VGPFWTGNDENEEVLLAKAYRSSLGLAVGNMATTIAFPNISTGVYRFPKQRAAEIAIQQVREFLQTDQLIQKVIFCCYGEENFSIYQTLLK
jgi:O-acetyl-ADP-ribose deacetylase (regulator of RNase III)